MSWYSLTMILVVLHNVIYNVWPGVTPVNSELGITHCDLGVFSYFLDKRIMILSKRGNPSYVREKL